MNCLRIAVGWRITARSPILPDARAVRREPVRFPAARGPPGRPTIYPVRTTIHARGPRPAAEVWERYAVPARWSEWAPYIVGVEATDDRIVAGTTGRVRGPLGVTVTFVVTAVDEDAGTWSWDVALGPLALTLDHGVAPACDGTRTWLTVDGPAPVLVAYLPVARISLEFLVRR